MGLLYIRYIIEKLNGVEIRLLIDPTYLDQSESKPFSSR